MPGHVNWWVEGKPTARLTELLGDPDRVLASPASVARDRVGRKRFYRLAGAADSPALFVKIFSVKGPAAMLRSLLRPSKAARELSVARRVAELGFDAVVPVAIGEERRFGALRRSFCVTREREARDLRALLEDPATDAQRRRALVQSFARLTRELHGAGIDQDDTSPNNFLIDSAGSWALIDFERCNVGRVLGKRRWTLLAKLHRHDLGVTRSERLRFLRTYLGHGTQADAGERSARRVAWLQIRARFDRVRSRDARRAASGAFREGRHVGRETGADGESWFVKGRENWAVCRLELGRAEQRRVWVLAHQLERLRLPALRPVRLGRHGVELSAAESTLPSQRAEVARARREFDRIGTFSEAPQWGVSRGRIALTNLSGYRLG